MLKKNLRDGSDWKLWIFEFSGLQAEARQSSTDQKSVPFDDDHCQPDFRRLPRGRAKI